MEIELEESTQQNDLEKVLPTEASDARAGRQRPDVFPSPWAEYGFCFSIVLSQIMAEYFISGFNVIIPTVSRDLAIPAGSSTWPASVFALTAGSSLLIFGRLADMYGGQRVYMFGLIWYFIWTIIAGFAANQIMLDVARALQGFGPAAFLTSGLSILGSTYRPGPRKNLVFSIYGGSAPIGFFLGIFIGGLTSQYLKWAWYFWIGAILIALATVAAALTVPGSFRERDQSFRKDLKMDWIGSVLSFTGLILVIFAVTDSGHAPRKWATSYVWSLFLVGCIILAIAVYVEGWVAKQPLLPLSLFWASQMTPLTVALFFSFGVLGAWLFYSTLYIQNIMGASPLQVVAWFVPFGAGGLIISALGGFVLHLVPGWVLLVVAGIAWVLAPMLFALAPDGASYWAWVFPAMICGTLGVDISYNITSIFITTSLPEHQQGLAGAVFNSLLFLGISFFLGFADLTAAETQRQGLRQSYKAALWFTVACAAVSLVLLLGFVRLSKAESEGDGREENSEERQERAGYGAGACMR